MSLSSFVMVATTLAAASCADERAVEGGSCGAEIAPEPARDPRVFAPVIELAEGGAFDARLVVKGLVQPERMSGVAWRVAPGRAPRWYVPVLAGEGGVRVERLGQIDMLAQARPDRTGEALTRVMLLAGAPGNIERAAVVAEIAGDVAPPTITTCSDGVWITARSEVETVVVRASDDLATIERGSVRTADHAPVTLVCGDAHAALVLFQTGDVEVVSPRIASTTLPLDGAAMTLVIDASELFDRGHIGAWGWPGYVIKALRPGRAGAYLVVDVARHQPGNAGRLLQVDLANGSAHIRAAIDALPGRALVADGEGCDGATSLVVMCAETDADGAHQSFGDVHLDDAEARAWCAFFAGDEALTGLTLRGVEVSDVAMADGLAWLAGTLREGDPLIGANDGVPTAFMIAVEPYSGTIVRRAFWRALGVRTYGEALVRGHGVGACAGLDGMALAVGVRANIGDVRLPEVRYVMPASDGRLCEAQVARLLVDDGMEHGGVIVSAAPTSCGFARALGLVVGAAGVVLGPVGEGAVVVQGAGEGTLELVTFTPVQCGIDVTSAGDGDAP